MFRIKLIVCISFLFSICQAQISLLQFSNGYSKPLDIKNCGDDRLFIVEQGGVIKICDTTGIARSTPFLDIFSRIKFAGEQGLLGLAFAPDFRSSGYFYVNYTEINTGTTCISRFHVDSLTPDSADPNSEEILLKIYQPFTNHNGGHLAFGPDGYLYIGMGDGGQGGDPGDRAQNPDSLLGKMLRLDVNPNNPGYEIPPTNPFASDTTLGRPEIYAMGFRNPWRWSFDAYNGDLWIGDVGQDLLEEIDRQAGGDKPGLNYGWRCYEADQPFIVGNDCPPYSQTVPPVYQYNHVMMGPCSVTGGYVYRGARFQELYGKYFYADFCKSEIQYLERNDTGGYNNTNLGLLGAASISTFGVDRKGELYCAGLNSGIIYHMISGDCRPVATINEGRDTLDDCGVGLIELSVPFDSSYNYIWTFNGNTVSTQSSVIAITDGTYYVYVNGNGCQNSDSVYVIKSQALNLDITNLDSVYCVYDTIVTLTANYSPGFFSGPGIRDSTFNPAAAGLGDFIITYSHSENNGCVYSVNEAVHVDECLDVPENNWMTSIYVYPNPSHGEINFNAFTTSSKKVKVEIRDVVGRIIWSENLKFNQGKNTLTLQNSLAKGAYIIRCSDEDSFKSMKFIVE